ncbi:MAG TPA: hypothetical protein VJV79_22185 [Polyangiaceae bacterium]|nr:hypothetical protein [Polyangiaceae bacterium]
MHKSWVLMVAGMALAACSNGDGAGEAAPDVAGGAEMSALDAVDVPIDVLHDFDVGLENIRFVRFSPAGETPAVLIRHKQPAALVEGAIERLYATAGTDLTLLEMFLALAPATETPHEALVALHKEHALTTRGDAAVRRVNFDRDAKVEKWTTTGCTNYAKGQMPIKPGLLWNSAREKARNSLNTGYICPNWTGGTVAGNCKADFKDTQVVAACNNGPGTMQARMVYRYFDTKLSGRGEVWLGNPDNDLQDVEENSAVSWTFSNPNKSHNIQIYSVPVNVPLNQFFHLRSGAWGLLLPLTPQ